MSADGPSEYLHGCFLGTIPPGTPSRITPGILHRILLSFFLGIRLGIPPWARLNNLDITPNMLQHSTKQSLTDS